MAIGSFRGTKYLFHNHFPLSLEGEGDTGGEVKDEKRAMVSSQFASSSASSCGWLWGASKRHEGCEVAH